MSGEFQRGPGLPKRRRASIASHGPAPCPWHTCQCTHEPPCVRGWIEDKHTGRVWPCAICRPEHHKILTDPTLTRGQQMARIQRLKER